MAGNKNSGWRGKRDFGFRVSLSKRMQFTKLICAVCGKHKQGCRGCELKINWLSFKGDLETFKKIYQVK